MPRPNGRPNGARARRDRCTPGYLREAMAGHTEEFEDALGVEFEYVHSASRIDHVTSDARFRARAPSAASTVLAVELFGRRLPGSTWLSGAEGW